VGGQTSDWGGGVALFIEPP